MPEHRESRKESTGIVRCPGCDWRGVPTYIDGERSPVCPACKRNGVEGSQ